MTVKRVCKECLRGGERTNRYHPEYVMSVVDQLASKDAIFAVDTG